MRLPAATAIAALLLLPACSPGESSGNTGHLTKAEAQRRVLAGDEAAGDWLNNYYFEHVDDDERERLMWLELIARHGNQVAMVNLAVELARLGGAANCFQAASWLTVAHRADGLSGARSSASGWLRQLRAGKMGKCPAVRG